MIKLTETIPAIITGKYTQSQLIEFINLTQNIALAFIKFSIRSTQNVLVLSKTKGSEKSKNDVLADHAIDSIAGLFVRNENNAFFRLENYFSSFNWQQRSEDDLLLLLKRLVLREARNYVSDLTMSKKNFTQENQECTTTIELTLAKKISPNNLSKLLFVLNRLHKNLSGAPMKIKSIEIGRPKHILENSNT